MLDLACGNGRHARLLASLGYRVEAADRNAEALAGLANVPRIATHIVDLERSDSWPYAPERFDGIVVTNYLFRPRFDELVTSLKPGGVLIYETFMVGNERFGKPSNPDFLLRPNELLDRVQQRLTVVAFEQGCVDVPKPACVQRICALMDSGVAQLPP